MGPVEIKEKSRRDSPLIMEVMTPTVCTRYSGPPQQVSVEDVSLTDSTRY